MRNSYSVSLFNTVHLFLLSLFANRLLANSNHFLCIFDQNVIKGCNEATNYCIRTFEKGNKLAKTALTTILYTQ